MIIDIFKYTIYNCIYNSANFLYSQLWNALAFPYSIYIYIYHIKIEQATISYWREREMKWGSILYSSGGLHTVNTSTARSVCLEYHNLLYLYTIYIYQHKITQAFVPKKKPINIFLYHKINFFNHENIIKKKNQLY